MYDTVNQWLSVEEAGRNNLKNSLNSLQGVTEYYNDNAGRCISGRLDNYKVNVSEKGISLKGSLAKYYLGNNLKTLTRSDTKRALEKMADHTGLPISKAKVNRIDVAQNFIMEHKPEAYFYYLSSSKYYDRLPNESTLYFRNKLREKLFYDKMKHSKNENVTTPDVLKGKNVLRYELRFKSRLPKQFGSTVIASDLSNEKFYINLLDRYFEEYKNIIKFNKIKINYEKIKSPKDYKKQKQLELMQIQGQDYQIAEIELMKQLNVFDKPEYYSRMKKEIIDLGKTPELTEPSALIQELDKKIESSVKYYR